MVPIKKIVFFKIAIGFLITIFSVCAGFLNKFYQNTKHNQNVSKIQTESMIIDLRNSKKQLEIAISEKKHLKSKLILEKQKVINLLQIVCDSTIDSISLIKYKNETLRLNTIVKELQKDRIKLVSRNDFYKRQKDSAIFLLTNTKKINDTIVAINKNLNSDIKKVSKLSIINLKTICYKEDESGFIVISNKTKEANLLKISFMIIGKKLSKICYKEYFIQIIDPKNNIIGENKTKFFGTLELNYSLSYPIKFENEPLDISTNVVLNSPEKGIYLVNIFDNETIVSKQTFVLK